MSWIAPELKVNDVGSTKKRKGEIGVRFQFPQRG
jgi:hypothetical protein